MIMRRATRGLQEAVHGPAPQEGSGVAFAASLGFCRIHKESVSKERSVFAANVPGCSKDRTYQPVLKTCAGPGQSLSPRGLCLEKSGQKIRTAKKLYLQEQMISLEPPADLHFVQLSQFLPPLQCEQFSMD